MGVKFELKTTPENLKAEQSSNNYSQNYPCFEKEKDSNMVRAGNFLIDFDVVSK